MFVASNCIPDLALAKVYQTVDTFLQALSKEASAAGANCLMEKQTFYLTEAQKLRISQLSGGATGRSSGLSGLWVRHRLSCSGRPLQYVYFDSHRVRTQAETLGIVVTPAGAIERIEVLSFDEPDEYVPKLRWFETFTGKNLSPGLELQRDIPMVTGATLSARAVIQNTRKVLAVHSVLGGA